MIFSACGYVSNSFLSCCLKVLEHYLNKVESTTGNSNFWDQIELLFSDESCEKCGAAPAQTIILRHNVPRRTLFTTKLPGTIGRCYRSFFISKYAQELRM